MNHAEQLQVAARLSTALDTVGAKLDTLIADVAALREQVEQGSNTSPEVDAAFAALVAKAEAVAAKPTT